MWYADQGVHLFRYLSKGSVVLSFIRTFFFLYGVFYFYFLTLSSVFGSFFLGT